MEDIGSTILKFVETISNTIWTVIPPLKRKTNGSLCFYANVDSDTEDMHMLHHNNLLKEFEDITGSEPDNILRIAVYRVPLNPLEPYLKMFYHAYLVLETERWYYSLETTSEKITLQRSTKLENVRDMYERKSRCGGSEPELIIRANGKKSIKEVMEYLHKNNRLNVNYNWFVENCKDMAKWIFDNFNSEGKEFDLKYTKY
ncbi:hypothetical protein I4U23_011585 [Adineta vaga]|nr:hypothetical protein I4U23_011585 [Adineta vaga]